MKNLRYIITYLFFSLIIFFAGCSGNQQPSKPSSNSKSEILSKLKEINENIEMKNIPSSFVPNNKVTTYEMKIINKNGILSIIDANKQYILTSRGLDYNAHISSDKKTMVVDVLKTNNLQIIELFSKKDTNRFKRLKRRLKREIWNEYLKDKTYEFKDIQNPQLKFYEWVDNDSFELTLSYEFKNKFNEKIVRYDIYK